MSDPLRFLYGGLDLAAFAHWYIFINFTGWGLRLSTGTGTPAFTEQPWNSKASYEFSSR